MLTQWALDKPPRIVELRLRRDVRLRELLLVLQAQDLTRHVHEPFRARAAIRNAPLVRRTTATLLHQRHKEVLWACRGGRMRVGVQMQQAGSLRNRLTTPLKSVTVPRPTSMRMRSRAGTQWLAASQLPPLPVPCLYTSVSSFTSSTITAAMAKLATKAGPDDLPHPMENVKPDNWQDKFEVCF